MRRVRVIPVLLIQNGQLVKTRRYGKTTYLGDPINAVKLFNDKEVDELVLLDINASVKGQSPDFERIAEISSEAFMPMAYGGGVRSLDDFKKAIDSGVEKVVINSAVTSQPQLISEAAKIFGSQSVIVSVDYKKGTFGKWQSYMRSGTKKTGKSPMEFAVFAEELGAGEVILNHIDSDSEYCGYDVANISSIASKLSIPLIASCGARGIDDFLPAIQAGASAVAAGSTFVFSGEQRGILINYPSQTDLMDRLYSHLE